MLVSDSGFIPLVRRAVSDRDPYWGRWDRLVAWLVILRETNYSVQPRYVCGDVPVFLGEVWMPVSRLSAIMGWSRSKAARYIRELIGTHERLARLDARHADGHANRHSVGILQVLNWQKYNPTPEPPHGTPRGAQAGTPYIRNKEQCTPLSPPTGGHGFAEIKKQIRAGIITTATRNGITFPLRLKGRGIIRLAPDGHPTADEMPILKEEVATYAWA